MKPPTIIIIIYTWLSARGNKEGFRLVSDRWIDELLWVDNIGGEISWNVSEWVVRKKDQIMKASVVSWDVLWEDILKY
jgi:hypothetical protein